MHEQLVASSVCDAAVIPGGGYGESIAVRGVYTVECIGSDGSVKWTDTIDNLVTTAGKNALLDTYLGGGTGITPALGLIDSTGWSAVSASDTMASHPGWTESTAYSNATRPAPSFGSASAGSKTSSATTFNINASATIKGCFLTSQNTKGGTTGTLYSAGLFPGGDKPLGSGDTLNITYTASIT